MNTKMARAAWEFYKSDSETETYIAVALVLLLAAPVLHRLWQEHTS